MRGSGTCPRTGGSAIVIHEKGDDYQASTPDSTGERIACGVIARR